MKTLFTVPGHRIWVADREKQIYACEQRYYDQFGRMVSFLPSEEKEDSDLEDFDFFPYFFGRYEAGTKEKLIPESVTEIEYDIDDYFGLFGFKNTSGEFVIEPQYAYAMGFTNGLAAVNLNRTWYSTPDGHHYYENHYGYINETGKTVIPFSFSEASPFNKYGVAVVSSIHGNFLIDMEGNHLPGTDNLYLETINGYYQRYLNISRFDETNKKDLEGLYDMKERRVVIEPSYDCLEVDEDKGICFVSVYSNRFYGDFDHYMYLVDLNGEIVYPWLKAQEFYSVKVPNKYGLAVVAVSEYKETEKEQGYIPLNGRKYDRILRYGIYSEKEEFVLPAEYDEIREIDDNLFSCSKDGYASLIKLEGYEI